VVEPEISYISVLCHVTCLALPKKMAAFVVGLYMYVFVSVVVCAGKAWRHMHFFAIRTHQRQTDHLHFGG